MNLYLSIYLPNRIHHTNQQNQNHGLNSKRAIIARFNIRGAIIAGDRDQLKIIMFSGVTRLCNDRDCFFVQM